MKQLAELSKLSPNKLLKKRYQKFRRMGESSSYSQEAMTREVELLMKITGSASHRGRGGQSQRRSGSDDEVRETTVTADD